MNEAKWVFDYENHPSYNESFVKPATTISRLAPPHASEDPVLESAFAPGTVTGYCLWLGTAPAREIAWPTRSDISKFLRRYHYSNLNLGSCHIFDIVAIIKCHFDIVEVRLGCFYSHLPQRCSRDSRQPASAADRSAPSKTWQSKDSSLVP